MDTGTIFLQSAIKRVAYYKKLGDTTLSRLAEADLYFTPNAENNNIAIIIQHMAGNMLSRWTDFLTSDGEKEWRNRDAEFDNLHLSKTQLIDLWEKGWACFLQALQQLTSDDLLKTIHIRSESLLVIDAINRQVAHYPYHVGQIIYIARIIKDKDWESLSVPKGKSEEYTKELSEQKPKS